MYLFSAELSLHRCMQVFSSRGEWGPLFHCGAQPSIEGASPVAEHELCGAQTSVIVMYGVSSCGSKALEHASFSSWVTGA